MPEPTALPAMSELVRAKIREPRNLAGLDGLGAWLEGIGRSKLGAREGAGERQSLAWRWIDTVARRRMVREGTCEPLARAEAEALAPAFPWAAKALAEGRPIERLALSLEEAEELGSALDWLRSQDGPRAGLDWSRISWPQALLGHGRWIEGMAARAEKSLEGAQALDGCEPLCEVPAPDGPPLLWVEVKTAEALKFEGAKMRHCVGSYADAVDGGLTRILSLRDASGMPKLTVEIDMEAGPPGTLQQIRRFANAAPQPSDAPALSALLAWSQASERPFVLGARSGLPALACAGYGFAWLGGSFGSSRLWTARSPSDAADAERAAREWASGASLQESWQLAQAFGVLGYEGARKVAEEALLRAARTELEAFPGDAARRAGVDAALAASGSRSMVLPGGFGLAAPGCAAQALEAMLAAGPLAPADAAEILSRMGGLPEAGGALDRIRAGLAEAFAPEAAPGGEDAGARARRELAREARLMALAGILLESKDSGARELGARAASASIGQAEGPAEMCGRILAMGIDASAAAAGLEREPAARLLSLRNDYLSSGMEGGARRCIEALLSLPDEAFGPLAAGSGFEEAAEAAAAHRHGCRELLSAMAGIGRASARWALHRDPDRLLVDEGLQAASATLSGAGCGRTFVTAAYAVAKLELDEAHGAFRAGARRRGIPVAGLARALMEDPARRPRLLLEPAPRGGWERGTAEALAKALNERICLAEARFALIAAVSGFAFVASNPEQGYASQVGRQPLCIQDEAAREAKQGAGVAGKLASRRQSQWMPSPAAPAAAP